MHCLSGRPALSPFRLDKRLATVREVAPGVTAVEAHYVYFTATRDELTAGQRRRLERLLEAGHGTALPDAGPETLYVTPRVGTVSPWSSKATDILRNCGLDLVERVERGVWWRLEGLTGDDARRRAAALLHDRMTESVLDDLAEAERLFRRGKPEPLARFDVSGQGRAALEHANAELGLALSGEEMDYLVTEFRRLGRDPTDAELMMFAQANSEHCRHKIFRAAWVIDGEPQERSLFDWIKATHEASPRGTLSAYHDNAAVMAGRRAKRFFARPDDGIYGCSEEPVNILMKVETHNHPTAISPHPGASTGAGGEIRDEAATGRGARPKAGLTGFSVSHLRLPGAGRPWEGERGRPGRIASALDIMLQGPIGAAGFNNEFGRPALGGYFRTFERETDGTLFGYHKPIMIAGGLGNVRPHHVEKLPAREGYPVVVLGGPAMLIGLGGGAASSVASGESDEELDFASVQRDNPEMQRRCQSVIDHCWALGDDNPVVSIHDVGAGGLSNAIPEILDDAGCGGEIELREVPSADPGLSPMQIWCNEAQERFVLALQPDGLERFRALCRRERCPHAVVGRATRDGKLVVTDDHFGDRPIDMPMSVLFGNPPRMERNADRLAPRDGVGDAPAFDPEESARRVLQLPAVAAKGFLITIGDRTVGGLCARDPMAGPWQVPVADCAVTLADFRGYAGEAMAMGERTPLAVRDAPASGRMAVGEALTNLAAAPVPALDDVKLSANWMAACGEPGQDAALYDTVRAVSLLCERLGIAIPVGKDSLSMKTVWRENGADHTMIAPISLIVSAFSPVADARLALTPRMRADAGASALYLVDLGGGRNRLGGSALEQVHGRPFSAVPDLDDPELLAAFFRAIRSLGEQRRLLAYHDRSDGGLLACLAEMAFAGRCGFDADLSGLGGDPVGALFSEELGAVVQVSQRNERAFLQAMELAGLAAHAHRLGEPRPDGRLRFVLGNGDALEGDRAGWQRLWQDTSYRLQALRDNPECAREELERVEGDDPGISPRLTFDPTEDVAAPFVRRGARPRVAVLREQGVNGHVEMAAAFDRAGFEAVDVHMSDIIEGRRELKGFKGLAAGGGFSYGDVLGAGRGWAGTVRYNERANRVFHAFFERGDTFTLGLCNGCQMLAALADWIPGAAGWPRFVRNRSEQYEARLATVEVLQSPSILFEGMAGSRIPVAVAHGEGRAEFEAGPDAVTGRVALRYVENNGSVAERYPANPNGSPEGITGLTTHDGRVTILMPHPERVFRSVQMSWCPEDWGEDSPWMRMFWNARVWVG